MSAKGDEKRLSCVLSCFGGGSSVSDETMPNQQERRRTSFSWSRFRAKKKTVPLQVADEAETIPPAKVSAAKKGFFRKFHKDKKKHESPTDLNKQAPEGSHTSPARHVISKCDTRTRTSPLFPVPHRSDRLQVRTKANRTGSTRNTNIYRAPNMRKKGKETSTNAGLIMLAVTLMTMLLGDRLIAILCISAWFYLSSIAQNYKRKKSTSTERNASSEQYKEKVVLQGLLERNGRRWLDFVSSCVE